MSFLEYCYEEFLPVLGELVFIVVAGWWLFYKKTVKWARVKNKSHDFGENEFHNTATIDGVRYCATDNDLEKMRKRADDNAEDFE